MDDKPPTYEELQARLAQAESMLAAISSESIDAVVGRKGVYLLRLNEMEKALRESEEKFRKAFDQAAVGFVLSTADGRFVEANASYCAITGYSVAELRGRDVKQLVHSEDYPENALMIERLLAGEIPNFILENRYVRKDGEVVWCRRSVSLVRDGQGRPQWVISLVEDITDRKRTEDSLAESLERLEKGEFTLETLMETVPDGITIAEAPDVRVLKVSRYGRQLLGKTSAELEGIAVEEHAQEWGIYDRAGAIAKNEELPLTRAVKQGEIVRNEEWVLGRSDGRRIPVLCNAAPISSGAENIIGGVVAWRDITELKQLEAELRQSNQELNEFTYALTHNVKAPFRAISNYASFLLEDLAETLEGTQKQYLEGIKKAIDLANRQSRDLEALYRIKQHELNFEAIDMRGLLNEIATLSGGAPDRELLFAGEWPIFRGERFLLRQILLGLVNNGFKYNRAERKRVEIGWQSTVDGKIEIMVRDNGIGIDPRYHGHIFEVFQRLHTDKEYEGTGIGLAIVRKAVKRLGGEVRIESADGGGSTFVVGLPATMVDSASMHDQ